MSSKHTVRWIWRVMQLYKVLLVCIKIKYKDITKLIFYEITHTTFLHRQHDHKRNIKQKIPQNLSWTKKVSFILLIIHHKAASPVPWNGLNDDLLGESFLEVHYFPFRKLLDEVSYYWVHLLTLAVEFPDWFLSSTPVRLWSQSKFMKKNVISVL